MPRSPADLRARVLPELGVAQGDAFTYGEVRRHGETVELDYHVDGLGTVTETFVFHDLPAVSSDDVGVVAAVRLLHLFAGVSYLKATLAPRVVLPAGVSPDVAALLERVLVDGLAELAHDHDVDLTGWFTLEGELVTPTTPPARPDAHGILVPVGGGKDSIVTLEALRDLAPELFAVNPRGPIVRTFEAAGLPHRGVSRRLDPSLFDWNSAGAINGHVPVTAIVSAAAVVAAVAAGRTAVVMSNEASADEATVVVDGREVNHQWSKSTAFETPFAAIVAAEVAPDLDYVSFLRPATELAIARRFTDLGYDEVFNSCNRAFHLRGETREWCGQCDKCRFVFLVLAPFAGRDRVVAVLGRNLLDDEEQVDGYAELLGLTDAKPFECVGEVDECRTALRMLAADPNWADDLVVTRYASELGPLTDDEVNARLAVRDPDRLPSRFRPAFDAAFER